MRPLKPKIQNYVTQTGVGDDPVFLWKYGEGNHRQTAYQINVYRGEETVYSTGRVYSDEQNNLPLRLSLREQEEYGFDVCAWDENGAAERSDRASFLTGVRLWRGQWIGNGTAKPFAARKVFELRETAKAVLSVCVAGQFEVRLNGRKVGAYAYEGSQTDFDRHVHYSTYDVTDYLIKGSNEIVIEAANGWYIGDDDGGKRYFYTMDKGYRPFGEHLAVLAQLKTGESYLVTDASWEVSRTRTVLADIYGSEDIDNTADYEWSAAVAAAAPKGEIIPCNYPPAVRKYCYAPQSVDRERMIFDFGQNMSSQFSLNRKSVV